MKKMSVKLSKVSKYKYSRKESVTYMLDDPEIKNAANGNIFDFANSSNVL